MNESEVRRLCDSLDGEVELVETHISWVLLAGDRAFKIKKPVDLGFVDFSTLDRRRRFCDEELRLNRRTAPNLYLDVVPITATPDGPVLDGRGTRVEYAVRMRRFDQGDLLTAVLARGELTGRHVEVFANEMADFHERCDRSPASSPFGTAEAVRVPVEQNLEVLRTSLGDEGHRRRLEALRTWSAAELERCREAVVARKQNGFVRECHGDPHLGNAFVERRDGAEHVVLFDGIEFSPELRWIDAMSDVAFTVMDLADRGRPDLAHRFLNAYVERADDHAGLGVIGYYLVYRSLVRAKVAAIRRDQAGVRGAERDELTAELEGYLTLAERLAARKEPWLLITSGVSGSGKSTVARHVVEATGAIRLRSDYERKRIASGTTEDLYSSVWTDRTYGRLLDLAATVTRAGFTAVVDATFLDRDRRRRFRELADELGVPLVIAYVVADTETLRDRVARRSKEGTDVSDADVAVLERQLATGTEPTLDEADAVVPVKSDDEGSLDRLMQTIASAGSPVS